MSDANSVFYLCHLNDFWQKYQVDLAANSNLILKMQCADDGTNAIAESRILCEYTTCIIHYNSLRHKNLVQTAVGPKYTSLQTHQDQQPLFAMCLPFSQKISQTSLRSIILLSLNACHGSHHLIVCFNWLKVANCQP